MQTRKVPPVLRVRRSALSLAVLTTASALVLAGCSSDSAGQSASKSPSSSPSADVSSPLYA